MTLALGQFRQAPRLADVFAQNDAQMGDPIDLPYSDNFGNVFQDSVTGTRVAMIAAGAAATEGVPAGA